MGSGGAPLLPRVPSMAGGESCICVSKSWNLIFGLNIQSVHVFIGLLSVLMCLVDIDDNMLLLH